ncbi:MAG: hypothetical protein GY913_14780 [Proteobacteria bacterium]|nr:hypothetical protein [Pseudomonadota bacterium]MCP4918175.1 hypothetical protein [Pseudomonadota bacterium]
MLIFALFACKTDLPLALVETDRSGHWLDRPFPHDELLVDGFVDWSVLPDAPSDLGTTLVGGWSGQASETVTGFSHQPAVYFRFSETFDVTAADVHIQDSSGADVAIEWSWVEDPAGDPWLAENLLVLIPEPTSPLASGERYTAWVSGEVALPAEGYALPDGVPEDAAVGTAFTVQNSLGQIVALKDATDAVIDANPDFLVSAEWKEVVELTYIQGETPSGKEATVGTVTYADETQSVTHLYPVEGQEDKVVDLGEDWPFLVLEGRITTVAWQGLEDQPYSNPGVGLLNDFSRRGDGWIQFEDGQLQNDWEPEEMRVTVLIPRDADGAMPVLTWDHGTGGSAYNIVSRISTGDDPLPFAEALSGAVVVSRDQPLYGQRYPLIDDGFGASIGFYNIGNLPCFRDNQRQATVDHRVLQRFVEAELGELVDVDIARVGAGGHSLGSVTAHGGLAASQGDGAVGGLMSGTGGYLTYYILETGLLGTGNDVVTQIAPLVGLSEEQLASAAPHELIAALVGLPEEAWPGMDRTHPVMQLFQSIMDPSDPIMLAQDIPVPDTIVYGVDDWQVPNITTDWLAEVHPDATVEICDKGDQDYDGHYCTFREQAGLDSVEGFVSGL